VRRHVAEHHNGHASDRSSGHPDRDHRPMVS
jgi:hypothetical protein